MSDTGMPGPNPPAPGSSQRGRSEGRGRLSGGWVVCALLLLAALGVGSVLWIEARGSEPPGSEPPGSELAGPPEGPRPAEAAASEDPIDARWEAWTREQADRSRRLEVAFEKLRASEARGRRELERMRSELTALREIVPEHDARAGAQPASAPSGPSGADLEPLRERLYNLEVGLQREGASRLEFQEGLGSRLSNLELQLEKLESERLATQAARLERLSNLETRIRNMEERLYGFEQRALDRLDRLESAR